MPSHPSYKPAPPLRRFRTWRRLRRWDQDRRNAARTAMDAGADVLEALGRVEQRHEEWYRIHDQRFFSAPRWRRRLIWWIGE